MKNEFTNFKENMLGVCSLLCEYGSLLELDSIKIDLLSYSTMKIDYADIIHIKIIDDKYLEIKADFGNITIIIDEIYKIEIE